MGHAASWCLLSVVVFQDSRPALTIGKPVAARITADTPALDSQALERRFGAGTIRRQVLDLRDATPGDYAIEASTKDFDPWLVVRDGSGRLIAEVAGTRERAALVVVRVSAATALCVEVGALRGGAGGFAVTCEPATPHLRWRAGMASAWAGVEAAERRSGPDGDLELAVRLSGLALLLDAEGQYARAEALYRRTLAIVERIQGPEHADMATALSDLGNVLRQQAQYFEAEKLHRRALAIRARVQEADDPAVASTLNNLAVVLVADGRYAAAEALHRRALDIWEKAHGPQHVNVGKGVINLAQALQEQGRYAAAEPLYRRALAIFEAVHGPDHEHVAQALYNLAAALNPQGKHAEADPAFERSVTILERVFGEEHREVAMAKSNWAMMLRAQGRLVEAEKLSRRATEILETVHGREHPLVATALSTLGVILQEQGQLEAAESVQARALRINETALGPEHPQVAVSLNNLALLHLARGRHAETERLYRRALAINEKAHGPEHPLLVKALANLLRLLEDLGRHAEAWQLAQRLADAGVGYVLQELSRLPADDRFGVAAGQSGRLDHLLSCARVMNDPAAVAVAWQHVTMWKGLVFRLARRISARDAEPPEIASLRAQLRSLSAELSHLAYTRDVPDLERHRTRFELLLRTRRMVQVDLMARLGVQPEREQTSARELGTLLPEGTALIDLIVHTPFRFARMVDGKVAEEGRWEEPRCLGFVVRRGAEHPVLVDLGPARELRALVERWLSILAPGARGDSLADGPEPATLVRERLWEPIARYLAGVDLVFVCADDVLAQVPFGAIEVARGRYALELARFVSVSDPVTLRDQLERPATSSRPSSPSLLALGAVDYARRAALPASRPASAPAVATRGERGFDRDWKPLAFTGPEVEAVQALVTDTSALLLRGAHATEEAFVREAPGRTVVHLATHGYFEKRGVASLWESAVAQARGQDPERTPLRIGDPIEASRPVEPLTGEPPELLAGIVLAGANEPAPVGRADGILTADEVAALDLRRCDLVVLSACETALGSARSGEGLVSLRRAFAEAGARTVVSTLWRVDDEATHALIERFYRHLWQDRLPASQALRRAQLWLLSGGSRGEWRAPRYWGAWLLAGEWR